jgi:NAD+ synthetase
MKILAAPINTTPGDFAGNFRIIQEKIEEANASDCKMVVFPELSIPGYLSCDMMFRKSYVQKNLNTLHKIVDISQIHSDIYIVVGYIDRNTSGIGKPFHNCLAVIHNGAVIGTYQKHLLPFYDVFDEGRYYEPGTNHLVLNIEGERFGFTICEDIWNDKGQEDYNYRDNPVRYYIENAQVDTIINISSSPYCVLKTNLKKHILRDIANVGFDSHSPYRTNIVYVNQYGGQDELVFNGDCYCITGGYLKEYTPLMRNESPIFDTKPETIFGRFQPNTLNSEEELFNMVVLGLRDYIQKTGFKEVVLGSSGGIDSAVVLALACEAIGAENVTAIMMPSIYSSEGSTKDAQALHAAYGCKELTVPIEHEKILEKIVVDLELGEVFEDVHNIMNPGEETLEVVHYYNHVADENIQARLRGMVVMHYSNATGAIPLTTGNKTENAVGYCTLYGDMNGGFNPIKDLYKNQVFNLARYINKKYDKEMVPESIINKPPTAELRPDQTDEASLLPYELLDDIVYNYIENYIDDFESWAKLEKSGTLLDNHLPDRREARKEYERIVRLIDIAEYKRRQAAPGVKVSRVAFGTGRRLPIVSRKGV